MRIIVALTLLFSLNAIAESAAMVQAENVQICERETPNECDIMEGVTELYFTETHIEACDDLGCYSYEIVDYRAIVPFAIPQETQRHSLSLFKKKYPELPKKKTLKEKGQGRLGFQSLLGGLGQAGSAVMNQVFGSGTMSGTVYGGWKSSNGSESIHAEYNFDNDQWSVNYNGAGFGCKCGPSDP